MMANSRLLLALVGAASADVNVRFTADFSGPVTSTSSSNCGRRLPRGGARRVGGLRIDGGGARPAHHRPAHIVPRRRCAQSLRRDGLRRLGAQRRRHRDFVASSFVTAVMAAGGTKPVASNYDTTYTSKYANLGGAVLLAVSETSTATYSKAVALAIAAARDAGVDFDTTPVILSVNGISTADITDLGASSAAAAVQKLAEENTEIDLVIATGISGLSTRGETTQLGRRPGLRGRPQTPRRASSKWRSASPTACRTSAMDHEHLLQFEQFGYRVRRWRQGRHGRHRADR